MPEIDSFLGKGWGFPIKFDHHEGRIITRMVSLEDDIRESLKILFSTRPGERIMHPEFGCGLHNLVFDELSLATRTKIVNLIENAILEFEHRIQLIHVGLQEADLFEGRVDILLEYNIRQTNHRSNMVYPFYFVEGNANK
ncbi:GPW/gp25 family protein [Spartinivicinus poritis]|uniref:GPW/gp25 family protein n=1 Tax=Spartinivicinus poritis TaxID=2994640 RepID=A0ABT5U2S6_9GAMM|nr:GPW/gp25 family protein [Spartinivicinus sp. A2-2]MDE1460672.1 GPW/gp25 family protein [Spartinivicinus sp. A2-2]